ncbi:telomeric repeat-binding factor 2-interacting protein 1 [Rhinophrynus dorsalis]
MASPEKLTRSCTLFVTEDGAPMRFYLRPGPLKRQLSPLISNGGGVMCRLQEPGALLLARPWEADGPQYINCRYIFDCVRRNEQLDIEYYRLGENYGNRWDSKGEQSDCVRKPGDTLKRGREGEKNHLDGSKQGDEIGEAYNQGEENGEEDDDDDDDDGGDQGETDDDFKIEDVDNEQDVTSSSEERDGRQLRLRRKKAEKHVKTSIMDKSQRTENEKSRIQSKKTSNTATQIKEPPKPPQSVPAIRAPFTQEEDIAILVYIRDNAPARGTVTGIVLWKEMESLQIAKRTWQAMKDRYRKQLSKRQHLYKLPPPTPSVQIKTLSKDSPEPITKSVSRKEPSPAEKHSTPLKESAQKTSTESSDERSPIKEGPGEGTAAGPSNEVCPFDDVAKEIELDISTSSKDIPAHRLSGKRKLDEMNQETADAALDIEPSGDVKLRIFDIANMEFEAEDTPELEIPSHTQELAIPSHTQELAIPSHTQELAIPSHTQELAIPSHTQELAIPSHTQELAIPSHTQELAIPSHTQELAIPSHTQELAIPSHTQELEIPSQSLGLKEFVMGEDSVTSDNQTQVDEVSSSPDASEGEGLKEALLEMMSEFKLGLCDVTQALLKNNGEVESTRHFLRTGSRPDGYPIWVRKDDLDLQNDNEDTQKRLIRKYGADNVAKRVAFLAS